MPNEPNDHSCTDDPCCIGERERYRNFFRTSRDAVFITTREGQWADMNRATVELLGYESRRELERVPVREVYADPSERERHVRMIAEEGFVEECPVRLRRKDGTVIQTLITSVPVRDEEGEVLGFQGTIRDVTEQKKARQQVRRLNSLLEAIRNVDQIIVQETDLHSLMQQACEVLVDAHAHHACAAALMDEKTGRIAPVARAGGGPFGADWSVSPEGEGTAPECVSEVLQTEEICLRDSSAQCAACEYREEGRQRRTATVPMQHRGQIVGVLHVHMEEGVEVDRRERDLLLEVAQDLAFARQKILADRALRDRETELAAIVGSAPFTMLVVDTDRRVRQINAAGAEFAGRSPEELTGLPPGEVLRCVRGLDDPRGCGYGTACQRCIVRNTILETLATRQPHEGVEAHMHFQRPEGEEERTFLLHATPVEIGGEQMALVVFNDITERRRAEMELEDANRRLHDALAELRSTEEHLIEQERHRALTQMASGIAHDFNNCLATILGFSELLLESSEKRHDDERALRYLELINKAASHASETVGRMRKFYRPREAELFAPLDLNALVEEAVSMTRPRWEEQMQAQGATIRVDLDLGDVGKVEGNEAELHEMLTNLIFNAVDAMQEGGRLSLSTHRADGEVVLEVADTGVGMSPEALEHCMEPFFTTKEETGSGLGLSTARGILERHDGEITVQSRRGRGTTFRITLPRAEPAAPGRAIDAEAATRTAPLKILVVENEEHQREMLTQYALTAGHRVETAAGGEVGLQKFAQDPCDVVITDRAMPEMRGDEVAAAVKKQAPGTPVIMLTGFGQMMDAANEQVQHVDLVLSKPITLPELRKALAQVSGKHSVNHMETRIGKDR